MRYKKTSLLLLFFFILMTGCLLCFPQKALVFSLEGLTLWFNRMIPALLPFMILSGVLIRMDLSDKFAGLFTPLFKPLFRLSSSCIYVIVIGFLCGFPMGARVCAESLQQKKITSNEAQFLLGFCNNIGPVYVTGYVLSLFPTSKIVLFLAGMYGIPLFYGLILRYTAYRGLKYTAHRDICKTSGFPAVLDASSPVAMPFFSALNQSIMSALDSITVLGGYMIFCNLLNLLPALIFTDPRLIQLLGGLFEITSGLARMEDLPAWMAYGLLTFGGLSCIAQTASCIRDTSLSIKRYVFDKTLQTALTLLYYLMIFPKI